MFRVPIVVVLALPFFTRTLSKHQSVMQELSLLLNFPNGMLLSSSSGSQIFTSTFFAEFSDYLEAVVLCNERLLITGIWNHVDNPIDGDGIKFLGVLQSFCFEQHFVGPTHVHAHINNDMTALIKMLFIPNFVNLLQVTNSVG